MRDRKVKQSKNLENKVWFISIQFVTILFVLLIFVVVSTWLYPNFLSFEAKRVILTGFLLTASFWGVYLFLRLQAVTTKYQSVVEQQAADQVSKTEGKYKALIQNSQDIIFIVNTDGKILYVSPSLNRILGYTQEELLNTSIYELIHGDDHAILQNALQVKSSRFLFSYRMQHHNSNWMYFECMGTDLTKDPYVAGIVLNTRDVTDRKEEEDARKQKEVAAIRLNIEREKAEHEKQIIEESKKQLERAYTIIEEKNEEITDSINYAFRIQHAIFPDVEVIRQHIPNSFVLLRPKDIVSGDFFWFNAKGDYLYIAAADCTGHGVPGAFMTMIGNTLLNQIILQSDVEMPDQILNKLHIGIRTLLKQDTTTSRDGMDISLVAVHRKTQKVYFAAANNPMVIIRNNDLIEIKADKQAIGGSQSELERKFTLHTIEYQQDDTFYIFSDGFQDQFGGTDGRKFMTGKFKKVLAESSKLPFTQQAEHLETIFVQWLGDKYNQIDDVLVVGFRLD